MRTRQIIRTLQRECERALEGRANASASLVRCSTAGGGPFSQVVLDLNLLGIPTEATVRLWRITPSNFEHVAAREPPSEAPDVDRPVPEVGTEARLDWDDLTPARLLIDEIVERPPVLIAMAKRCVVEHALGSELALQLPVTDAVLGALGVPGQFEALRPAVESLPKSWPHEWFERVFDGDLVSRDTWEANIEEHVFQCEQYEIGGVLGDYIDEGLAR